MPHSNPAYTRLIVGLGETGFSCARYFKRLNLPFTLLDSRINPPKLSEFQKEFPHISYHLGPFDPNHFQDCGACRRREATVRGCPGRWDL